MAHTFGAAVMGDHVNIITDALPVTNVIAFALSVASGFKDRFIRTFRQACSTRDAFIRNQ
jgi:hypothetical protein